MKKIFRALIGATMMAVFPASIVLAIDNIATMTANPTDTTITLTWVIPAGANNTVIRYRTDTYPTSPTDGVLAYNNTGFQTVIGNNLTGEHLAGDNISALTAGQSYYFAAWGQNSTGTYSTLAYNITMSTLAYSLANGGVAPPTATVPQGILPASMTQSPNNSKFNLAPFDGIINNFNNAPGGLGMPINNAWETLAIVAIIAGGVITYLSVRNFFAGWSVSFVLTIFMVMLHLTQGWLVALEIIIGLGVWAVDHYLQ